MSISTHDNMRSAAKWKSISIKMVLLSVGLISKLYMNDAEDKLTEKETTANSIVTTETYDYSYHDR